MEIVIADVIKVNIEIRTYWMWVGPKLEYLYKRHRYRKDNHMKAKIGVTLYKPRKTWGHQKLDKARMDWKDSSLENFRGSMVLLAP